MQLDLLSAPTPNVAIGVETLPDAARFPHNEGGATVGEIIAADLVTADDVLIVTGYASLAEIVRRLAPLESGRSKPLRLLFGAEPFTSDTGRPALRGRLAEELRDHWMARGFSPELSGAVLQLCELVKKGDVRVRIGEGNRPVHAKIYATDLATTVGSSNFTQGGLQRNVEANVRFDVAHDRARHAEAWLLAEALWAKGRQFDEEFVELLLRLCHPTSWRETLARGCALLLEGEWAREYVSPDDAALGDHPLWPHQLQGISQALWILEHVGSALVADATGSGKTRMGAWLLRAAFDRRISNGHRPHLPLVLAPPSVMENWRTDLQAAGFDWNVRSHGALSNEKASSRSNLDSAIHATDLLAIDEAHNFLNNTKRTKRLVAHHAEQALLFTATPINRRAADVLSLVELLGADNFSDEALSHLRRLRRSSQLRSGDIDALRKEIQRFTVRRTRSALNRVADENPESYRTTDGRPVRYPRHQARFFSCDAPAPDREIAARISLLADGLLGVLRVGKSIELPRAFRAQGVPEERYLDLVCHSAAALARFHVMKCLRSSRAALLEHLIGTEAAWERYAPAIGHKVRATKMVTGNVVGRLVKEAGKLPAWKLGDDARAAAPHWLLDAGAHRDACERDRGIYESIAALVEEMSDARERAKVDHLCALQDRLGKVIAFDGHVITLEYLEQELRARKREVHCFTGQGGTSAKRHAVEALGLSGTPRPLIALCSDALSEGVNLQGASCVVHLDTPTVVRIAEQRAGRVDRMNSPFEQVEIWWPRDPPELAAQRRDLLRERHELVSDLIGANLELPVQDEQFRLLADHETIEMAGVVEDEHEREEDVHFTDAFEPIRRLIGDGGLIPTALYRRMRDSQAELRTCVTCVSGAVPWAFLAVGTPRGETTRWAPRWIFFDGLGTEPILDLGRIAEFLQARLGADPTANDTNLDEKWISRYLEALRRHERALLPIRRRRALDQLERVLGNWADEGWVEQPAIREEACAILDSLRREGEGRLDPRLAADAWLELLRPRIREALENRAIRKRLWRLSDLDEGLCARPISAEAMRKAFRSIPRVRSIESRVEAMIIGIPSP